MGRVRRCGEKIKERRQKKLRQGARFCCMWTSAKVRRESAAAGKHVEGGREREKEDRQSEGNRKREGGDQAGKETVERRQEASPRGLTQTAQTRRTNTTGAGAGGGGCVSACVR